MSYPDLSCSYDMMKDINQMHKKTPYEIDKLNKDFEELLDNVKKPKEGQILNKEEGQILNKEEGQILNIEEKIREGKNRIEKLKLFDEKYNITKFNTKNICDLSLLIINPEIFHKKSHSTSYIFKAQYCTNPSEYKKCYIKAFFIREENLIYEQQIYNYIKTRNEQIKEYYEDYFVKVYDNFKVSDKDFTSFLRNNHLECEELEMKLNFYSNIYLIITEDIEGITYKEFFENNYTDEDLMINTLFDMIYGIYLMNDRLKLMHNDNHFSNVLIKTNLLETSCKYQIGNVEYIKQKKFRLCFYDFDFSYLIDYINPYLQNKHSGKSVIQNKFSAKDIWSLLNSILRSSRENITNQNQRNYLINTIVHNKIYQQLETFPQLNFYSKIINLILNNDKTKIDKLKNIYLDWRNKQKFWNANCVNNIQEPCNIPHEPELYPLNVLLRLIADDYIITKLKFITLNSLYKKYLKYKIKYIELKNINK